MGGDVCCICMEGPSKKESIQLLACGCNSAWFHNSCEIDWIDSMQDEMPYPCPTCRRVVPMKINYSFSYDSGEDQKYLWTVGYFFTGEACFIFIEKSLFVLTCQSGMILLIPFIISTERPLSFYLYNVHLRVLTNIVFFFFGMLHTEFTIFFV